MRLEPDSQWNRIINNADFRAIAMNVDLLDPRSLAHLLTAQSALQDTRGTQTPTSANDSAAAVRHALGVCEMTAALLRAQLTESQGNADRAEPPAKRPRAIERGEDGVRPSSSTTTSTGCVSTVSTDSTFSWTKKVHTQQPDGSWRTIVVPCGPRPVILGAASAGTVAESDVNILAGMQDELRREVLDFSRGDGVLLVMIK